jgi:hypothetical protein
VNCIFDLLNTDAVNFLSNGRHSCPKVRERADKPGKSATTDSDARKDSSDAESLDTALLGDGAAVPE